MRHDIIVHETPDPSAFGIECSCGWRNLALWGRGQVERMLDAHYAKMGVESKVVVL